MNYCKQSLNALLCAVLLPVNYATYAGGGSPETNRSSTGTLSKEKLEILGQIYNTKSGPGSTISTQPPAVNQFPQDAQSNQQVHDQSAQSDEPQGQVPAEPIADQNTPDKNAGTFQAVDTGISSSADEWKQTVQSLKNVVVQETLPLPVRSCAAYAEAKIDHILQQMQAGSSPYTQIAYKESLCYARWVVATADTVSASLKRCESHIDTLKNADAKYLSENDRTFIKNTQQFITADEYMFSEEPSQAAMNYAAQLQAREQALAQLVKQSSGGFHTMVHFVKRVKALPVLTAFGAGWILSKWAYEEPGYTPKNKKHKKGAVQSSHASHDDLKYYEGGMYE